MSIAQIQPVPSFEINRLYNEDNVLTMQRMPDNFIDLVVTSPPYNVGKEYEEGIPFDAWLSQMKASLTEAERVLVCGGRICINIANTGRKPYIPLHSHLIGIMQDLGLLMRGEIIWNKGASVGSSTAWGSWRSATNPALRNVHEFILIFSKSVMKKSKKGPDTIGRDEFLTDTKSIWAFPPESATKIGHPCPFPIELPARLINLYSFEGDLVYDPFMGSGTRAIAALNLKRDWIGSEIKPEYCDLADQRITELLTQPTLF